MRNSELWAYLPGGPLRAQLIHQDGRPGKGPGPPGVHKIFENAGCGFICGACPCGGTSAGIWNYGFTCGGCPCGGTSAGVLIYGFTCGGCPRGGPSKKPCQSHVWNATQGRNESFLACEKLKTSNPNLEKHCNQQP